MGDATSPICHLSEIHDLLRVRDLMRHGAFFEHEEDLHEELAGQIADRLRALITDPDNATHAP